MADIFEGRWRCTSCRNENRGRVERCEGCGVSRPAGVQFYLPGNEPALRDGALLADAHSGRDWYCDHCDGANKNAVDGVPVTQCVNCGQARDAGDAVHVVTGEIPVARRDASAGVSRRRAAGQNDPARRAAQAQVDAARTRRMRAGQPYQVVQYAALGCALMIGIAMLWAVIWAMRTHEVSAEVTGKAWERSIAIESVQTLRRDGWSLPAGARRISSERRQRGTREVVDHYRTVTEAVSVQVPRTETYPCGTLDMGNGFFQAQTCTRTTTTTRMENQTRQEPVYRTEPVFDTWYVYEEDVWSTVRRCSAAGLVDAPFWQDCPFTTPGEREGGRAESYTITLAFDEITAPLKIDQAAWDGISIGQTLQVDVSRGGTPKSLSQAGQTPMEKAQQ